MKVRITSNPVHWLGKEIGGIWDDTEYFSRETGWDINNCDNLYKFVGDTPNYDLTINFYVGYGFKATILLSSIQDFCHATSTPHTILNIGSYQSFAILHNPTGTYDLEKALLKLANRKVNHSHTFHGGMLDSRLINLSYINGSVMMDDYPHINGLDIAAIIEHIKLMMITPSIKELSLQISQPGNHRVNEGKGPILRSVY